MRFYEAMKLLEEGKKVRKTAWDKGEYDYIDKEGELLDNRGNLIICFDPSGDDWEEYIEDKDINVPSKIEELDIDSCGVINEYNSQGEVYARSFNMGVFKKEIVDKLNEVIRRINNERL